MSHESYLRSQKVLHWLLAVLLLFWLFVSGELVEEAEGADKATILIFHSSGALIILALMLWRLKLRSDHPVAPLEQLKTWEQIWGKRVHLLFYILVPLMVFSGLLQGLFLDTDVRLFGVFNIAQMSNEAAQDVFHTAHGIIANILKLLILLHILAALKHQFIDRQKFIRRMF